MGTAEDSLSVAISAFTSLRMGHLRTATELYLRAIALLRVILAKKNSNKMDNLVFAFSSRGGTDKHRLTWV